MRARMRDIKWYGDNRDKFISSRQSEARTQLASVRSSLAVKVAEAISEILKNEIRPRKIIVQSLSSMVGISDFQVRHLIKSNLHPRTVFSAANADMVRRRLLWAARLIQSEGRRLYATEILNLSGLTIDSNRIALAKRIIVQLTEGTANRSPIETYPPSVDPTKSASVTK